MKLRHTLAFAALLAALGAVPLQSLSGAAIAADAPAAAEAKAGWYSRIVDADFVARYAVLPKPDGVQIIDSRPTARKYDPGHIPTALSLPDSQFDKLADKLPQDKATLLIFYCDGLECMLSHNSAFRAEKLGYTDIRVYAAGFPDWVKNGHMAAISVPHLKKLMDEGAPMALVDSRPKERKYDKGHIPGAISLPDSQFDKLVDRLPADKASPLYFYCEGLTCRLSSDSAAKAVKLGYTQVKVVPEGYPEWERLYGAGPTAEGAAAAKPVIQAGKESGTIAVASFEKIYKEAPDTIHLIDVREPNEFAAGTFKGAVNVPVNTLEKRIDELPADKPIVFFCGAGGRSGEAHDMVQLYKPALKTFFLNADIKWARDGSYTMVEKN
ncbi:rhodanese-like domain-containing protein [Aromatoleum evansii]|uniref:Rhodanese-like domain-containing protein n=1 Tax=Aromatoleum evansii TaxID=59406 RepID=A0ABZ1ALQ6_AROEV|nr:rhodanese-like domain-containing protein [Aromatoleum evansii]NMG28518.1 rhodanese-like domain-containing protein [Aromatoleum evansii]WRL45371.1 rhodanese-like domain-containing protein [Aromatoleum evansii]